MDLLAMIAELDPADVPAFVDALTPAEVVALDDAVTDWHVAKHASGPRRDDVQLKAFRPTEPDEPYQIPPRDDFRGWLFLGGRGAGKSLACGVRFYDHMTGPPCIPGVPGGHHGVIVGPTIGDASQSAVNGPSGLATLDPRVKEVTRKGGTFVVFPDSGHVKGQATARVLGAHGKRDVDRLRASGANTCVAWCEELAAWQQVGYDNDAWDLLQTGLRLGPRPQWFASTTPKPTPLIRELHDRGLDSDDGSVVYTHGTMYDNADNLAEDFIAEMESLYGGTRVEAQELLGKLLDYVQGALWTPQLLEDCRVSPDQLPAELVAVAVGVDPAFSEEDTADEAGIVVAAVGTPAGASRLHGYVLDDRTCRGGHIWPKEAVKAYREYEGDVRQVAIVAESNLGGKDFIRKQISNVDPTVRVQPVQATQGKRTRAEPVAMLYDQRLMHHVGTFPLLEQEMTTWTPGDPSPNRLDSLAWAGEHLRGRIVGAGRAKVSAPSGRIPGVR